MNLNLFSADLLPDFLKNNKAELDTFFAKKRAEKLPADYFDFYRAISSVYSSKIEGEEVEFDSYFKYKFLEVPFLPDYTQKSDDLFEAYKFMEKNELSRENVMEAHAKLCAHLLPSSQRGQVRRTPMFVLNAEDRIEYVACPPHRLAEELELFFEDIEVLKKEVLTTEEIFYFAAYVHLLWVKIHPMADGNGRLGRLLEKWFLKEKLGEEVHAIELEKNYYQKRTAYYDNLRVLGLEYENLSYEKALPFLAMTITHFFPKM
jgi:Fic family protein